jgi:glutamyl-tRNA reductase
VEVYAVAEARSFHPRAIFQSLAQAHGLADGDIDFDQVESLASIHRGEACVQHLFRVASSLDSLVVGETEIVGQVKKAYQLAHASGVTGKVLNRLFQAALSVSKRIRNRTGIGRCSTSVGAVALDVAERIFGDELARQTVLIIGAGKVGETTLRHLRKRGAKTLLISNRSIERARELASEFEGEVVPLNDLARALCRSDLVISSTSAQHHVLTKPELDAAMRTRVRRPILLIDLAVPRDIDPAVQELDGVYLYNIDQLADLARENLQLRQAEAVLSEQLVSDEARKFIVRFSTAGNPGPEPHSLSELFAVRPGYLPAPRLA